MEWPLNTVYVDYQASPIVERLIENLNAYLDPRADLDRFYELIWSPKTAEGYGLDCWGRIVGVSRVISVTGAPFTFGFNDGFRDYAPFNQAPFYDGTSVTTNYALPDDAFRQLVFTKAFANISACSSPSLNRGLNLLFGNQGRCYVNDLGDMEMRYTFEFPLTPVQISILENSGALLRPAGVGVSVLIQPTPGTFGFNGSGCEPFNQGTFLSSKDLFSAS